MKIAVVGYGTMGKLICEELGPDCVVVIAPNGPDCMSNLYEYENQIDLIIDFSNPANLNMILQYANEHNTPIVFGTTGFNQEQEEKILSISKVVPVLRSSNYSIGSLIMKRFLKTVSPLLEEFDVEIVRTNSSKKINDPTDSLNEALSILNPNNEKNIIYNREGNQSRSVKEIGVHNIRGGSLTNTCKVMFCGESEIISIEHTKISNNQFAKGAVLAANWLINKQPGIYTMEDVIFNK